MCELECLSEKGGRGRQLSLRGVAAFPQGEEAGALEQPVAVGLAKGRGSSRRPPGRGPGERASGGAAMPPATRRGQHNPRRWRPRREPSWRTAGQRFGSRQ